MFKSLKFLNEGFDRRYLKEEVEEELFHNDNGTDYVIVERSKSGKNALLRTQNGKKWIIAWNCPKSNEGSWGQGHYFFDEHEARDLWEKKYINESVVGNAKNWLIDKEGKTPKEAERIINNSSPEEIEDIALRYTKKNKKKANEDWNIEDQIDAPETIGKLNKGDKFINRKGVIITITDPTKDGRIQYCVGDECRSGSEKSIQQMLYRNNYLRMSRKNESVNNKRNTNELPYVKWVKKADDGSWVMWGGSYSPDLDKNFLDRINHPKHPNPDYNIENQYVAAMVLPAGKSPYAEILDVNEALDDQGVERYGVNGKWWYFTTHGVQPGSVPKGIKILDIKDGKNKKGTRGTFFASDRVLNTSELDRYDIKEEVPVDESLTEDTVKQNGKWVNKGKEGTHGKFATKKAADAQRKAMFANGYKAESLNESSRTWAEKKYDELMEKGKDQWDEDDWDAYHYIMQVWGEMGYFDESLNESEESDIRVIRTGLSGAKNNEILNSIIGQMSDGIWENSPSIEPYWMFANVDDDCNFVVKSRPVIWDNYNRKGRRNPYYQKPDHDILRYFANKLKQIVREYANDKGLDFKQLWNRDSEEVCDYLGYDEDITIGDAFKVYQALR